MKLSTTRPRFCTSRMLLLLLLFGASNRLLHAQRLVVLNPSGQARTPEVLEVPLSEIRKYVSDIEHATAENAATHQKFATQIYQSSNGDQLLIALQFPERGNLVIDFVPTSGTDQQVAPLVFGRDAPERKDDFAWENQYVAYRVYGPALEAAGEITSGIDVWSKRVPNLVINSFYKHDAEGQRTHNPALSYHRDDGVGLDSYLVGPSRGCGGTGVLSGGKLWVSNNYTHLKQISEGPVRFEFELTYAPWDANGIEVTETKRITLDAGTHLNKIRSTFTFTGAKTIDTAAGLGLHPPADFEELEAGRILSDWDAPQDPTAGKIATGVIAAPEQPVRAAQLSGQALMIFSVHSGEAFTYYAGSGWSRADMPTHESWNVYLRKTLFELRNPLQYHWEKDNSSREKEKKR
jgi:hypothetical protein